MSASDKIKNKVDTVGGKGKQAAGSATGDESLKAEGNKDEAKGNLKDAGENVKDAIKK
jgi:uncharacterized protein YjbJ (UPF0337 family)